MNAVEAAIASVLPDIFSVPAPHNGVLPSDRRPVLEGQRNTHLTSLAGFMRYRGMATETILVALFEENRQVCQTPLDEPEVRAVAMSVGRYASARHPAQAPDLEFFTIRELAERVANKGPRRWLLRGIWPSGDYGVLAAEMKAQKTWNATDMAVSVASGTPWLGLVPVDDPGPVLMFAGEGGEANSLRRLRAVATARGVNADDLPIHICLRAPHLTAQEHLRVIEERIHAIGPRLVTLDPLYLSARGAKGADLYAMGEVLEPPQRMCQAVGAALLVVTHFNRKPGQGVERISGAGPGEWGRVLMTATVPSRSTDAAMTTIVTSEIKIIGGEIPDQTMRVVRRVWAGEPDDLESPLYVETTATKVDNKKAAAVEGAALSPTARKLVEVLTAAGDAKTSAELVDRIGQQYGPGLARQTVSSTLNELERRGVVSGTVLSRNKKVWRLATEVSPSVA